MFGKKSAKNLPDFTTLLPDLQPDTLKTAAARHFMEFCQKDFPTHTHADGFDPKVYADAARLVLERLEATRHME